MNRDEFLQKHWTPYPQLLANHRQTADWKLGKIAQKNSERLQLFDGTDLLETRYQDCRDAAFGNSIPFELLQVGDVVAYEQTTGALYLLSPNLMDSKLSHLCESRNATIHWQKFLDVVRTYFQSQGFRYWHTPQLLVSPGIDAHIDFFSAHGVRTGRTFFLPTSPEFALKKAIADGETHVFEIKPCFRDDDDSPTHKAEFLMLEWYRAYADKWELCEDFKNLVRYVVNQLGIPFELNFQLNRVSIAELFKQYLNFSLTADTTYQELKGLLVHNHLHTSPQDDWDDLFFRLYIEFIEPYLEKNGPLVVYNFPLSQGSLARQTKDGWADRFEIYWDGLELANAYQEQNDPKAMEERYRSEIKKRIHAEKEPHPHDPEFLQKMQQGFPPCAGIALGLDRLWMVLNQLNQIQHVPK